MAIIVLLYLLFIIFLRRFLRKERLGALLKYQTTLKRKDAKVKTDAEKEEEKKLRGDAIALGSVIVSIIALTVPFIQSPLIDYNVYPPSKSSVEGIEQYRIEINNLGSETAKNVVLSLKADKVRFIKFTSDPVLSEKSTKITNDSGNAFFNLQSLPPRSLTWVTADMNTSENPDGTLTTFVRGDETVGYHGSVPTIIIYSIYVGILLYVSIVTIRESWWRWWHNIMIVVGAVAILVIIFMLAVRLF
jgi:hypothetical protein